MPWLGGYWDNFERFDHARFVMGTSRIRPAGIGDALDVAAIVDIAGHGIDHDHWMNLRDGDHSVMAAARRLIIEDRGLAYHYSRAHILEFDDRVAGGMVGGLPAGDGGSKEDLPPHLIPLIALENRVRGCWNILALAVYPEFRGQGLASTLVDHAVQLASQSEAAGLSIVVENTNTAAIALYAGKGFKKVETLPWIAFGGRVGPAERLLPTTTI